LRCVADIADPSIKHCAACLADNEAVWDRLISATVEAGSYDKCQFDETGVFREDDGVSGRDSVFREGSGEDKVAAGTLTACDCTGG